MSDQDTALVELTSRFAEFAQTTDERLKRIESGIVGDEALGHEGIGRRIARVERERKEGDQRIHERIDRLEGKWRLAVGIAIGASIGSGGIAAVVTQLII